MMRRLGELIPSPLRKFIINVITTLSPLTTRRSQTRLRRKLVKEALTLGVYYTYGSEVEGDIAEFGTMTGETALTIAAAMRCLNEKYKTRLKVLHLFDSFEGLPHIDSSVDEKSPHVMSGAWSPGSCKGISKQQLEKMCTRKLPKEKFIIYDGWFRDTLSQILPGTKFSMLHIDCDLYQSTIEVLDFMLTRSLLSEGAVVFFDDWNCNKASLDFGERKAWSEAIRKYSVIYSDGGDYSWTGHRFIVHGYKN